ncbi:MAG: tyrosine-type recombinase/integrase [Chloroflexi bacterium]|nr:tyrosine-type recombinase/integrase [Chloroflexota bacterium]MDA1271890.1 tyrosine-type recombinase/integrase [Chloroflexota bacterium]
MRGSIEQRSRGSWRLRYDGPQVSNRRRKQITETVKGTKKEAERVLRERLAAIENGGYVPKDKETVGEFMDRWLVDYAATNTTLRTQEGYRGNISRYIRPALGSVSLQALAPREIQGMYAAMLDRGLSARTVLHTHRVLKQALGHAVKWGLLLRNVADGVTPPKPQLRETKMWDAATVNRFLEAARNSRFRDLYHLAVLSGMRRSETCGLKWESVDLTGGKLAVVSTLQRLSGKGLVEGQPKTPRSRRSIALSPATVDLLHGIRGRQIEQRLIAGDAWDNIGYVFTQSDGTPVDPESVSKDFRFIVRNEGLPSLTFHGLRHAHATLLLKQGVHPKIVSERLGHSNIAVTMDIYSHVLPGLQEQAALALDEALSDGTV